ncbi:hypothetical protein E0H75_10425 [Kribbella capetownensis]|uniref:DUF1440 domain-containing protein n=1 Tax=Kribbella capetownensis TaxID=1572659 RepID=A0A4R0K6F2_9ACTN|nr:hypothetical protein [Kribbella capetownensis]TCC50615.1 hypothetical protein E0H75_10425 [Kribbella capetownensis]
MKRNAREVVAGTRPLTALGAISNGVLSGAVGTLAMDLLLYARYRKDGGKGGFLHWEFSSDIRSWDQAPAPAQVGKRVFEGLFRRQLPDERAALVNNVMHWGYGIANGARYGVVAGSLRTPRIRYGAPFGAGVWASGYVVLPAAKLYEPIWKYDRRTLAKDLSAHLVYGLTTAAAFRLSGTLKNALRRSRTR